MKWPLMDGAMDEILNGRLTVHFASDEDFLSTSFAKKGLNHPVLLALRYLRLAAMSYYQENGTGRPDPEKLFALDPASASAVRAVIEKAASDGSLEGPLGNPTFERWINFSIRRAFLSYTNPTAAKMLLDHFGVPLLSARYPKIGAYNQYLFSPY